MPQNYAPEFKKKIVRLHEEGRTYKSITAEYGISKCCHFLMVQIITRRMPDKPPDKRSIRSYERAAQNKTRK